MSRPVHSRCGEPLEQVNALGGYFAVCIYCDERVTMSRFNTDWLREVIGERFVGGRAFEVERSLWRDEARAALVAAQEAAPAHPVIDREALIHAIAARHWDEDSGEVENWDGLTTSEKQNVIDNYLCPRVADAVIAHLSDLHNNEYVDLDTDTVENVLDCKREEEKK